MFQNKNARAALVARQAVAKRRGTCNLKNQRMMSWRTLLSNSFCDQRTTSAKILQGPQWEFPGDNKAEGLHGDSLLMPFQRFKTSGIRNHVD